MGGGKSVPIPCKKNQTSEIFTHKNKKYFPHIETYLLLIEFGGVEWTEKGWFRGYCWPEGPDRV